MGKVRRGDIRNAVFAYLIDQSGYGYEIMQHIEAKTEGLWKPSPGSIYPTLQQLEDEGLVQSTEADGRRVFELTKEGRAHAVERLATYGAPWDHMADAAPEVLEVKKALTELQAAVSAAIELDDANITSEIVRLVRDTRRAIYSRLLES